MIELRPGILSTVLVGRISCRSCNNSAAVYLPVKREKHRCFTLEGLRATQGTDLERHSNNGESPFEVILQVVKQQPQWRVARPIQSQQQRSKYPCTARCGRLGQLLFRRSDEMEVWFRVLVQRGDQVLRCSADRVVDRRLDDHSEVSIRVYLLAITSIEWRRMM